RRSPEHARTPRRALRRRGGSLHRRRAGRRRTRHDPAAAPPGGGGRVTAGDGPIRVLVVDDEPLARKGLRMKLAHEPDVDVVGEAEDGPDAVRKIANLRPDLVFLDVQMPGKDGFQVLEDVADVHLPEVIFVTAFDRYALRAFDAHALDYLVKPTTDARFKES